MESRISAAAHKARADDEASIRRVRQDQRDTVQALRQIVGHARAQQDQREHLLWGIGGGVLAGCLLGAILPGMVARAVPESWHWPERIAGRMIGEPSLWEAGSRMMQAGSPEAWRAITAGAVIRHENKETIAKCERKAATRKKSVPCTIRIGK